MKKTLAVHDGAFHADDAFAVAALLLREPDLAVVRTRETAVIDSADYAVDVGGISDPDRNRFDHHQKEGAGARLGGIPYAAFGLVWRKFGEEITRQPRVAALVDARLVAPVDARDNGVSISERAAEGFDSYDISDAVQALTPTWEEESDMDNRFSRAVALAKEILEREIVRARAQVGGEESVLAAYRGAPDKRLVVLERDYLWKDVLNRFPEPLFAVVPQEKEWFLYCVRDDPRRFVNRRDLPEGWAGLRGEEFARATGVADAIFCHRNRFMAVAKTKEGALALAKLALTRSASVV